ncbi:MAG: hypothetical protein ACYDD6_04580 [Acidimicrobiales bacterium]
MATLGAAAMTILAMVSNGGSAMAAPILPAGTGVTGFNLSASGTGLGIDLFGTVLTGGTSAASASYSVPSSGAPVESATATGEGIFLTSGGVDGKQSVSVPTASGATTAGSNTDTCAQGGGGGESQGAPFNVALGLGCAAASASVDPSTDGPQAFASGKVADLSVDLSPLLNKIAAGGATQLCTGLLQIPTLGTDILGPACSDILASVAPSVDVSVGTSVATITTSPTELLATDKSSAVDIKLFPTTITGGATKPLLEVVIPSAVATTEYTAANGWSNTYDATLISISGLLVDGISQASGGQFPDPLEIPPNNSGTAQLGAINSSPLGALLSITLASGATSGSATGGGTVSADGLKINLLGGQSSVPGGGVTIDTSGVQTAGSNGPATASSSYTPTPPSNPGVSSTAAPIVSTLSAASPTLTHTGEWWAGSLPLLVLLAALGGGLIAWPRLRRFARVSRLISRGSR